MKVAGIIAEFNPFHNGHRALCTAARQAGATHIAAVMGGNFVQRGDIAITDKRVRAACALECGVDLVLELPLPWGISAAQTFARGGVSLLAAAGCVDTLAFGSESGETKPLQNLAQALADPRVEGELKVLLSTGITYARGMQLAVERVFGSPFAAFLSSPNNLLAIEYLRAVRETNWQPELFTLKRQGASHDGFIPVGEYASASYLRGIANRGTTSLAGYIPPQTIEILAEAEQDGLFPTDISRIEMAILAILRRLDISELRHLPDISEGLENRLYTAIKSSTSLAELFAGVKTKRYTLARVRRLVFSAFLGIKRKHTEHPPPYIRILGLNQRGEDILAKMKDKASLPMDTSIQRIIKGGCPCASALARAEVRATDLYTLALPKPLAGGYEKTARVVVKKI